MECGVCASVIYKSQGGLGLSRAFASWEEKKWLVIRYAMFCDFLVCGL